MKTILLMTAVLVLAGCGEKKAADAPAAETSGMAPRPIPAWADVARHRYDASDTTMARDTAAK